MASSEHKVYKSFWKNYNILILDMQRDLADTSVDERGRPTISADDKRDIKANLKKMTEHTWVCRVLLIIDTLTVRCSVPVA